MRPRGSPPANAPVASTSRCCCFSVAATRPNVTSSKSAAASVSPRRIPAPLPRTLRRRRHQQSPPSKSSPSTSRLNASWVDYIPRIVENIPRRVPPGAHDALQRASSAAADGIAGATPPGGNSIVDVGGAVDALRRLVFPESLAAPSDLTLPVVIFGALGVGLVLELATLALKAVEGGGDGGGSGGGGGGPGGATTPPVDAPIVPPPAPAPPSSSTPPPVRAARAPTTPSRAQIEAERRRLRDRIVAERYRGLTWLAAATAAALFTAGLLSSPTALRP